MLRQLPKGYDQKFLKKLLKFSVKPMLDEAKRRVPEDRGDLKKATKVFDMRKARNVGVILGIKSGKDTPYYGSFVEFGTVKQDKQPFMRPAWDAKEDTVKKRFFDNAKRKFELEVKRLTKKGVL